MLWLPSWLGTIYSKLYKEFVDREFTLRDVVSVIKRDYGYVKTAISKLCKAGWCVRMVRGSIGY